MQWEALEEKGDQAVPDPQPASDNDIQHGKWYASADGNFNLQCVKAGKGGLVCNGEPMGSLAPRKPPSSD